MLSTSTGPRAGGGRWPVKDTVIAVAVTTLAYAVLPSFAPARVAGVLDEVLLGVILGIVVGMGLRLDVRLAPIIGATAFIVVSARFALTGSAFAMAASLGLLIGCEIVVLILVIRATSANRLERPQDVLSLVLIALAVGLVMGALAATITQAALPGIDDYSHLVRAWMLDSVFGIICIAPVLLTIHRPSKWSWGSSVEFVVVAVVSLAMAWFVFRAVDPQQPGLLGWPYLVALGPLWIAIRLGVAAVAPVAAVVSWLAATATVEGFGAFAQAVSDTVAGLAIAQLYTIVITITVLLVGILRDARARSMHQLRESSRLLSEVVDGSSALVYAKSYLGPDEQNGRYVIVNEAWAQQTGKSIDETLGSSDVDLFPDEFAETYRRSDREVMETGRSKTYEELAIVHGSDEVHHFNSAKFPLLDDDGQVWGVGGISTDTTELVKALQRERRQGDLLRAVFELSPTPAMRLSVDEALGIQVLAVNSSMCLLLEAQEGDASACDLVAHVHPDDRSVVDSVLAHARRPDSVRRPPATRQREVRLVTSSGRLVWTLMSAAVVGADGDVDDSQQMEVVAQFEDFTARRVAEEALSDQALRDSVTGLPNRRALHDRLDQGLSRLRRNKGALAVLFCDLDHFKDVNDTLGHQAGDLLLVEVARRMQAVLRPDDTVARIGGDEFIAVGEGFADVGEALTMASRITERIRTPWMQGDKVFRPSVSIGVAFIDDGELGADEVLRRADLAMYRAKENGRGRIELYERTADERYQHAVALQHDLRHAIDSDALVLHYQPIVSLDDESVLGAEALVRMPARDGTLLKPYAFVPQAEATGLIVPMGAWVVRTAVTQLKSWRDAGQVLTVSINVSPAQLRETGFAAFLLRTAESAQIDPSWLAVEVTETALLSEPGRSARELKELSSEGVGICLDDFGTGYSSLSWLTQFPVDVVKVDRTFTDELGIDDRKSAIVSAVIQVSHDLGFAVVAEGVETREQAERLIDLGCDRGQGYLFGYPVAADAEPWAGLTLAP